MATRIMVVEDNAHNLYLITFLLGKSGYEVITAHSGPEALGKIRAEQPDLILMDIQLPEMDGYETTRKIKQTPECSHIPIIAVTSYALPGDKEKALAAGCTGYMEKPFAPETFVADVAKYLEAKPGK